MSKSKSVGTTADQWLAEFDARLRRGDIPTTDDVLRLWNLDECSRQPSMGLSSTARWHLGRATVKTFWRFNIDPAPALGEDKRAARAAWIRLEDAADRATTGQPNSKPDAHPKRRANRRRTTIADRPLTDLQKQAFELYGKHNSNITAAADEMGITRQAFRQHIEAAWRKIPNLRPKQSPGKRHKTQRLPTDRRGQATI